MLLKTVARLHKYMKQSVFHDTALQFFWKLFIWNNYKKVVSKAMICFIISSMLGTAICSSCKTLKKASKRKTSTNNSTKQDEEYSKDDEVPNPNEERYYSEFDCDFLDDGDIEWDEDLIRKFIQKKKITNKYSDETDEFIKLPKQSSQAIGKDLYYISKKGIEIDIDRKTSTFLGEGTLMQEKTVFKAGKIHFDWGKKLMSGCGIMKQGTLYAPPIVQQKKDFYLAKRVLYNTETEKTFVTDVVSPQKEGILTAKKVKKDQEKLFYAEDIQFSTCKLENPHFSLNAKKAKIIKDDRAITGPFWMHFGGIPSPLGFCYSVFKITEKRESGFLFPDVGFNSVEGIYINDFGYYFAPNDYIGLAIKSGLDSQYGNIYFNIPFLYAKRYDFNGKVDYKVSIEQFRDIHTFSWSHKSEDKSWGVLNVDTNFKYEKEEKNKNGESMHFLYGPKRRASHEENYTNADINYNCRKFLFLPWNLNLNLHHDKRFGRTVDGKTDHELTLEEKESTKDRTKIIFPSITLKTDDIYLFSFLNNTSIPKAISNINFSHKLEFKYEKSGIEDFGKFIRSLQKGFMKNIKYGRLKRQSLTNPFLNGPVTHYGAMHTIPLSTNFTIFKHFSVKPYFTWKERWYLYKLTHAYDFGNKKIMKSDLKDGVYRVGEYDTGIDLQTSLEFRHLFAKENFLRAFRHKVTPIIGFNYSPGFGLDKTGYYQRVFNYYTKKLEKQYKFDDLYGSPKIDPEALITFKLRNIIDFKIRDKDDYEKSKNVKLFKTLDFSTAYNLLAERYKLKNLHINTSSGFWDDKINIKTDFEIDPYRYDNIDGKMEKIDDFTWNYGGFLGEVRKAKFNIELNLKPEKDENEKEKDKKYPFIRRSADKYIDFDIPWNIRVAYNIEYHKLSPVEKVEYNLEQKRKKWLDKNMVVKPRRNIIGHSILVNGDIDLTKKWKLNLSVLYNIKDDKFEEPKIGISRDLHCWQLQISWSPFTYTNSLDFVLRVKANILKSIKYRSRGKA